MLLHFGRIKQIAAELLLCKLAVIEFVIESAFGEQLLVCALFNNVAVLHNKDNIAFLDCSKSVGNNKARLALHHLGKSLLNTDFGKGIN